MQILSGTEAEASGVETWRTGTTSCSRKDQDLEGRQVQDFRKYPTARRSTVQIASVREEKMQ